MVLSWNLQNMLETPFPSFSSKKRGKFRYLQLFWRKIQLWPIFPWKSAFWGRHVWKRRCDVIRWPIFKTQLGNAKHGFYLIPLYPPHSREKKNIWYLSREAPDRTEIFINPRPKTCPDSGPVSVQGNSNVSGCPCGSFRVVEWVALIRFLFGMWQYESTLDFAFLF